MLSDQVSRSVIFTNTPMYLWMGRAMYSDVGKCPAEDTCMMSRPDENVRLVRRRRDDVSSLVYSPHISARIRAARRGARWKLRSSISANVLQNNLSFTPVQVDTDMGHRHRNRNSV